MAGGKISGLALGSILTGSVFTYAGIKGKSIPATFQLIIQGKDPRKARAADQIQGGGVPGIPGGLGSLGSASGQAIAADALQYVGHPYCFGGAEMAPSMGCPAGEWDCSSFCNWVIGHDMGLAIPGMGAGTYRGLGHGPATSVWFAWPGCTTIGTDPAQAQPGDLAIWDIHHMGICLGPDQMVSAQNPADGTQVSAITGFTSGLFAIRRLKAVGNVLHVAPGPLPGGTAGGI